MKKLILLLVTVFAVMNGIQAQHKTGFYLSGVSISVWPTSAVMPMAGLSKNSHNSNSLNIKEVISKLNIPFMGHKARACFRLKKKQLIRIQIWF